MSERYVIVTPAYNEARYIGMTIESVLAQTIRPQRWVIVDDGSTDETPSIIQRYTAHYPWIEYLRREKVPGQHYFASNVFAIQVGIDHLGDLPYEYLAILDADISLTPNYYEQILSRFARDERLGIASGVYVDRLPQGFRKVLNDRRSTPKSITVIRKPCYEQIGGFIPMKYGGEDTVACFMARMKGWKTWSFPDIEVIHNKPIGTGHASNILKIRFRQGINEYFLASPLLFVALKCFRRCLLESPFIFSGIARFTGYCYGFFLGQPRQIPEDVVRYIRRELRQRAWNHNQIPDQYRVVG
jgi:biofilm PGA synthesis N-glycosyltransferase PgaC